MAACVMYEQDANLLKTKSCDFFNKITSKDARDAKWINE